MPPPLPPKSESGLKQVSGTARNSTTSIELVGLERCNCPNHCEIKQLFFYRAYSVDAHLLDGIYHSRGLLLDVNCITTELELQHCKWQYAKRFSCLLYLGVKCAGKIED
jgi:hypothetical protein